MTFDKDFCFVPYRNPYTGGQLQLSNGSYVDPVTNEEFPIINGCPRFCQISNYTESFGFQWNKFGHVQIKHSDVAKASKDNFYKATAWNPAELTRQSVLEVGCGAGRFSNIFLETTNANLYSIDYSNAVEDNFKNNMKYSNRLFLSQASIYNMPFSDCSFDKVFCFRVLQHTPSFSNSIRALVAKTKIGGEIVIDFYPINGWYTKLHSKYLLRPFTKRISHRFLLKLIKINIGWMIKLFDLLCFFNLGLLTRFIPITDLRCFPSTFSKKEREECAIMDTFDAFSPEFDNPQRIKDVVRFFSESGCQVTFASKIAHKGGISTVVRAIRRN